MASRIENISLTLNRPEFPFSVVKPENLEFQNWSGELAKDIDPERFTRLWGGYSNYVVRPVNTDEVWVYWREEHRWQELLRAVVLENVVTTKFGISGRSLLKPEKPLEVEADRLLTRFNYVDGENIYPWEDSQIVAAAQMQTRLNKVLRSVSFDPNQNKPSSPNYQLIHGDFDRGNVLFSTSQLPAVIDYERADYGSIARDMGKTACFILVDTQVDKERPNVRGKNLRRLEERFEARLQLYFRNYGDYFKPQEVLNHTIGFLRYDDYGDLNYVRDFTLNWLARHQENK